MNKICVALLALLPTTALAFFPIEVEQRLNGAEISYDAREVAPNVGGMVLINQGQSAASCSATFRSGPDTPRTRRVTLEPGERANLTARFTRDIVRLRIQLDCELK